MYILLDQIMLFVFTVLFAYRSFDSIQMLATCLCAITVSCFLYFYHSSRFIICIVVLYSIVIFFFPILILLMPFILYNTYCFSNLWLLSILTPICILYAILHPSILIIYIIGIGILALYMCYRTIRHSEVQENIKRIRDENTEVSIVLKERNHTLIEMQNSEIYAATLRERNRIAREIHDNVGHMLSSAILIVGALKATSKEAYMQESINDLHKTLSQAMDDIRDSVHDLHNDSVNLKETVETLVREFTFCPIELVYDMSQEIPKEIKYSFIMILKEALSNVIKHSNASKVNIILREHPGLYQFVFSDNGSLPAKDAGSGIGLINIKDRILAMGGTVEFKTEKGFCIYIIIAKDSQKE